jgi:hypothetical protein
MNGYWIAHRRHVICVCHSTCVLLIAGSPDATAIAEVAQVGLGWVTEFIGKQPDGPGCTKEQAIRALVISIQGLMHQTAHKHLESMDSCWAGLKAILSEKGGFAASTLDHVHV